MLNLVCGCGLAGKQVCGYDIILKIRRKFSELKKESGVWGWGVGGRQIKADMTQSRPLNTQGGSYDDQKDNNHP